MNQPESDTGRRLPSKGTKYTVADFLFGRTLGEGSYSMVVVAVERHSNYKYAAKILTKKHIVKENKVKYVNVEKQTLTRLRDFPGVVRLHCTFQDPSSLYYILDYATNGELLSWIRKFESFDETAARFYGAEIATAVAYVHSQGVIHRDLKPENILLDSKMHIKLTDFGTAKMIGETESEDELDSTAEYVSPELLTEKSAGRAADWWAFGCIVYQLLAGRPPFKGSNEYQTFQKIIKLQYTFPDGFPETAQDLVRRLLLTSPQDRIAYGGGSGVQRLKSHAFFKGIIWENMWDQTPPKIVGKSTSESSTASIERKEDEMTASSQELHGSANLFDAAADDGIPWVAAIDYGAPIPDPSGPLHGMVEVPVVRPTSKVTPNVPITSLTKDQRVKEEIPTIPESRADIHEQKANSTPSTPTVSFPNQSRSTTNSTGFEQGQHNDVLHHDERVHADAQTTDHDSRNDHNAEHDLHCKEFLFPDEVVLRYGQVKRHGGFLSKKRLMYLTNRPRLFFVDPKSMKVDSEVFWSPRMVVELKSSKMFSILTTQKTYHIEDLNERASEWVDQIHRQLALAYGITV